MAQINFQDNNDITGNQYDVIDDDNTTETISTEDNDINNGLSQAEFKDANNIVVTLADKDCPIVVLFGPTSCGKTMALTRLTRYLKQKDYNVAPVKSFRPAQDSHYANMCNDFNNVINSDNAAKGTNLISFMLVDILNTNGKKICQVLEAPGEYYFDKNNPQAQFPTYIQQIIQSQNKKIWAIMVEPDWENESDRKSYVDKISELKRKTKPKDKFLFLYNKVDKSNLVNSSGQCNTAEIFKDVKNMYQGIFSPFENNNPITRFFNKYNCSVLPFSNGTFTNATNGNGRNVQKYIAGDDNYPKKLWDMIIKLMGGKIL